MNEQSLCELCGEPIPEGEPFRYHGFIGPCPKPPKKEATPKNYRDKVAEIIWRRQPAMVGGLSTAYEVADEILQIVGHAAQKEVKKNEHL